MWHAKGLWILLLLVDPIVLTAQLGHLCEEVSAEGELRVKANAWERVAEICDCPEVRSLELKKSPLIKLPPCLSQLHGLRSIDLSKSSMVRFPDELTRLFELEHIGIANTNISYLPDEIADLPNLKSLDLRGTGIVDLPHGLGHLERIDMRLIMMSKLEQNTLRERFPNTQIFFSSPCHCH